MTDTSSVALPAGLSQRYRIGRTLGSGGMSTVYAAYDTLLQRDVAVKVFKARASAESDLRTQQAEAQLVASLNHYALTTLFDAGVDSSDPGRPQVYLVMEYIPGSDLRERLRRGPLTPEQICWLGFDLAEALDYVHEAGFIHHDLKPANVLLADRRAESRIRGKLTDFGIATIVGRPEVGDLTTGTAAYLSPEQVDGEDATPRSDVYALGLVLLEAITGTVAFPGSMVESAFARLDRDPGIPASVPAPLADVLRGMTARRPEDRLALKEVARRLQTVLVDEIIVARGIRPDLVARDEAERVAALRRYDILDDPSDDAFDVVTRLAARMLRVPIALVTIIDTDRVLLRSRQGLDLAEVARGDSFCATTDPGSGRAWTVPDALVDPRTAGSPLVLDGPRVRSYAAAPLVTRDGHHLGALCVFDHDVRRFGADELADLTDLASMIMRELELRLSSRRVVFNRSVT